MRYNIFKTGNDWTGLIIRLTLGLILFPHGAQKLFGWFGGPGFTNEMSFFTDTLHLPWLIAFLVIVIEFAGSLCFIAGFASRAWAVATIILFAGIIFTAHLEFGFFMNWFGNQKGEGFEYFILMLGIAVSLVVSGAGRYSIDSWIANKKSSNPYLKLSPTEEAIFR